MVVPSTFARVTAPKIGFQSLKSAFCNKPQPETQKVIKLRAQIYKAQKELKELGYDPIIEYKWVQFTGNPKATHTANCEEMSDEFYKEVKFNLLVGLGCFIFFLALVYDGRNDETGPYG